MFEYFRLKKAEMRLRYLLLSKLYETIEAFPDLAEIATELKGLKGEDLQKAIVSKLVPEKKTEE